MIPIGWRRARTRLTHPPQSPELPAKGSGYGAFSQELPLGHSQQARGSDLCLDASVESRDASPARIRPATADDIPALLDLWESVAEEGRWIGAEAPIDRVERAHRWRATYFAGDSACAFVAETEDGIVGAANVEDRRGLVELGMLVGAEHRRHGIGTQLLRVCIGWATSKGAHKITLQVWPHNEPAIALYEKLGFEREGYLRKHYRRKSGAIWDVVVMGLLLDDRRTY